MKKLALLIFAAVPSFLFLLGADCSGSGVVPCPGGDADCAADANGNTNCSDGTCSPPVCGDDVDCQLLNPAAPTTSETCATDDECANDGSEACVETSVGETVCAIPSAGAGGCGGDVEVSAKHVEDGANIDVCGAAGGTCSAGGGCTF